MIGVMLVGAWFLIHQQCCIADAGSSSRSVMVDPLMRRSPLEKNFIRFGRSWPRMHYPGHWDNWEDNSMTSWKKIGQRETRGKENFIRFGRTSAFRELTGSRDDDSPWTPLAEDQTVKADSDDQEVFANKVKLKFSDLTGEDDFQRPVRNKQNFIRFGRSSSSLSKNKKYQGITKDNFIRFGRRTEKTKEELGKNFDSTQAGFIFDRNSRDKNKNKNSGFIRFGKSQLQPPTAEYNDDDGGREKRSAECALNLKQCNDSCDSCTNEKNWNFDPTSLVAPEFSLLPKIPFKQTPLNTNFIRLG